MAPDRGNHGRSSVGMAHPDTREERGTVGIAHRDTPNLVGHDHPTSRCPSTRRQFLVLPRSGCYHGAVVQVFIPQRKGAPGTIDGGAATGFQF